MRMAPEYAHFNHTWVDVGKCYGYDYHDLLPFSDLFGENDANRHLYSNEQLYRLFDPQNPTLPYVYDTFDWSQCASS